MVHDGEVASVPVKKVNTSAPVSETVLGVGTHDTVHIMVSCQSDSSMALVIHSVNRTKEEAHMSFKGFGRALQN